MDLLEKKIAEGLQQIAERYGGGNCLLGANVTAVDVGSFTCTVMTDDDIEVPGVLYKSNTSSDVDVVMQPADKSRVIIGRLADSDAWTVLKFGKIDKVQVVVGNSSFEIESGVITLNGGQLGGMVKRDGVRTKLNQLEAEVNALKTIFKTWVTVPSDGGAALKALASTWAANNITPTKNGDLENTNVKQ